MINCPSAEKEIARTVQEWQAIFMDILDFTIAGDNLHKGWDFNDSLSSAHVMMLSSTRTEEKIKCDALTEAWKNSFFLNISQTVQAVVRDGADYIEMVGALFAD